MFTVVGIFSRLLYNEITSDLGAYDSTVMEEILKEPEIIVSQAHSSSLVCKKDQAALSIRIYAAKFGLGDPDIVSEDSPKLVLNFLNDYAGLSEDDPEKIKSLSAVNGMIAALRWVYKEKGHTSNWSVAVESDGSRSFRGNPMEGHAFIKQFRRMFERKLATMGKVAITASPIQIEHVVEHAKKFLLCDSSDLRDELLHALLLTGMNCGMRLDELTKIRMECFKCTKYGIQFSILEGVKNDSKTRHYAIRNWPGKKLSECAIMDANLALAAWVLRRGDAPGYLFCSVSNLSQLRIDHEVALPRNQFIRFLHSRLESIGVPPAHIQSYTGHSIKRGGVQLLRALGVTDATIMKWFGMSGEGSYIRYTEICNQSNFKEVPGFSSSDGMVNHVEALLNRQKAEEYISNEEVANWLHSML